MGFQEKIEKTSMKNQLLMLPFVMFLKKMEGSTFFDEISTNYIGCINVSRAAYY